MPETFEENPVLEVSADDWSVKILRDTDSGLAYIFVVYPDGKEFRLPFPLFESDVNEKSAMQVLNDYRIL